MGLILAAGEAMSQQEFLNAITNGLTEFSLSNLTTILVAGVGIAAPLVLAWFGYRFVSRKASGALKKGRL